MNEEDMSWEAGEFDKALDYVSVLFGALLSAYLGVVLSSSPDDVSLAIRVCVLLACVAFIALNLRSISHSLIHGIETKRHFTASVVAVLAGCVAAWSLLGQTPLLSGVFLTILTGWFGTAVIATVGIILRRWIKWHE